ncbi:MAG: stretch-activated cation channel mid1 [Caeruleum heppii]|nr:MAG: stretch-activated cation channel mid1 [Caeruleum heppii]
MSPFPKLSPLQSRFAASLAASLLLVLIYLLSTQPSFAYAADSIPPEDHNHRRLLHSHGVDHLLGAADETPFDLYEAHFPGMDRGIIGRRAPEGITALGNNAPRLGNLDFGRIDNWVFPRETLLEPRHQSSKAPVRRESGGNTSQVESGQAIIERQDSSTSVFITLNTCLQPSSTSSDSTSPPPPLEIFISRTASNPRPGPDSPADSQETLIATAGYASLELSASDDIFISISAPSAPSGEAFNDDPYNYELAVSIDAPYHTSTEIPFMNLVDTDSGSALFFTSPLPAPFLDPSDPQKVLDDDLPPPFTLFAHNTNSTTNSIAGLENSYCGLKNRAQRLTSQDNGDDLSILPPPVPPSFPSSSNGRPEKDRRDGIDPQTRQPRQQIHLRGLNASSTYVAILAMTGNGTDSGGGIIGGGGHIYAPLRFTTKSESNCAIIHSLPFCSHLAHAVPSNPNLFPPPPLSAPIPTHLSPLASFYDTRASSLYRNFTISLSQIACETSSTAQYSLARTCTDCALAYKNWLCAVTMPRCTDYSSPLPYLAARNIAQPFPNGTALPPPISQPDRDAWSSSWANRSRNSLIDQVVRPGPYKEVLPCRELCHELVRSCPAALGFACPAEGKGLERSYGRGGECSAPGEGVRGFVSGAGRRMGGGGAKVVVGTVGVVLVFLTVV